MLEKLEFVYNVIENLEEKGYEVIDLQILNDKASIMYKQYGIQTTMKLDLNNLDSLNFVIC